MAPMQVCFFPPVFTGKRKKNYCGDCSKYRKTSDTTGAELLVASSNVCQIFQLFVYPENNGEVMFVLVRGVGRDF